MNVLLDIWKSPAFHAVIMGAVGGLGVDLHAFLGFKSLNEAKTYSYGTAALHAVQGAIGALIALGGFAAIG